MTVSIRKFFFACLLLAASLLARVSPSVAQTQVQPPVRHYQVRSYDLTLDWRNIIENRTATFSGENDISLTMTSAAPAIVLDAEEMTIDSVQLNDTAIVVTQPVGDTLSISLPEQDQAAGTPISLDIFYTHHGNDTGSESGIFYFPAGTFSSYSKTIPEDLIYTMSEPDGARKWMPCNDEPYYKASSSISIIVPNGYSAQSNGALLSIDTDLTDGSLTFRWQSDEPIATYLMAAYASKWVTWRDYYHRLSNPDDSVPVIYYAWQEDYDNTDSSGNSLDARFAFRHTPDLIAADSKLFGEYPFTAYSQVPLDPFGYGGMEHQTITALYRGILYGNQEEIIAHELFHHWFGDKTTCETWADIWLNEGFATFGEMLWAQGIGGSTAYDGYARNIAYDFFYAPILAPTYDPPVDHMFDRYVPVVYYKPGCVLYMLRRMLNNDTMFFNTLRDYSSAFAYTSANTFQFRDFIVQRDSARAPMDLKTFIDEWIFQPDWPIYNVHWSTQDNQLIVHVDQEQDSTDHYTMPLRFWTINGSDTTTLTFLDTARSQTFTASLPSNGVQTLAMDTMTVLMSSVTMTEDQNLSVNELGVVTWPLEAFVSGGTVKLSYAPIVGTNAELRILDVLGRTVLERDLSQGSGGTAIPISQLANGDYFATLTNGGNYQTAKFHLER
ncbi:MAG TPA: M1 family aminopeptidase [Candidatus Kapabacteria bacterium]|jgi:aminopeptidase N